MINDSSSKKTDSYSHTIKTYALCEACTMTDIASIMDSMDRNIDIIIQGQQQSGSFISKVTLTTVESSNTAEENFKEDDNTLLLVDREKIFKIRKNQLKKMKDKDSNIAFERSVDVYRKGQLMRS